MMMMMMMMIIIMVMVMILPQVAVPVVTRCNGFLQGILECETAMIR
jgi:hypothetical protein